MSGILCFQRRHVVHRRRPLCDAITRTNINILFSYLVKWKISHQRRPLWFLVKIQIPIWPPQAIFHRKNQIYGHISGRESHRPSKLTSTEAYYKLQILAISEFRYNFQNGRQMPFFIAKITYEAAQGITWNGEIFSLLVFLHIIVEYSLVIVLMFLFSKLNFYRLIYSHFLSPTPM